MKLRTTLRNRQSIFSTPSLWALTLLLTACAPGSSDGDGVGGRRDDGRRRYDGERRHDRQRRHDGRGGDDRYRRYDRRCGHHGRARERRRRWSRRHDGHGRLHRGERRRERWPRWSGRRGATAGTAGSSAGGGATGTGGGTCGAGTSAAFPPISDYTAQRRRLRSGGRPRATPATPPSARTASPCSGRRPRSTARAASASDHRLGQRLHEHRRHLAGIPRRVWRRTASSSSRPNKRR